MTSSKPRPAWRSRAQRLLIGLAISSLVAGGFAWLLHAGGLPVLPRTEHFAQVRWWAVAVYVVVWLLVLLVRSLRWQYLLRPIGNVPTRRVVTVSLIGLAALVVLPLRMGEAVRPAVIARGGAVSGWAAAGTVAAERVIDGLVLSVLLVLGLGTSTPIEPLPERIGESLVPVALVPRAAGAAVGIFATAFVLLAVFYWRRAPARRMTERMVGVVSPRLAGWLADRLTHVAAGLGFLPDTANATRFLAATLAYWLLSITGAWLLLWGCGFETVHFGQAIVVIGVLALGILVPNAPGYFGTFQLSVYAGMALYFPVADITGPGAAFVFLLYVVQIVATLLCGGVSLLFEHLTPREAIASELD